MTPNGPDRIIQGMGPDVDVKAIKKEVEEALIPIFKKHKLEFFKARYILDKVINITELM
jgi:hypothetical protein